MARHPKAKVLARNAARSRIDAGAVAARKFAESPAVASGNPDARRPDARGLDARGLDARGLDARGLDARGPDARRPDARGTARGPRSSGANAYADRFAARLSLRPLESRWAFDLGLPDATASIVLQDGDLVIADTQPGGRDDRLTISADTTRSLRPYDYYRIEDPYAVFAVDDVPGAEVSDDGHVVEIPFLSLEDGRIVVRTEGGDDQLTLDLSISAFEHGVEFDGGAEVAAARGPAGAAAVDSLRLIGGGPYALVSHQAAGPHAGSITIDGSLQIVYSQVQSIDDGLVSQRREFLLADTSDIVTLEGGMLDGSATPDRLRLSGDGWTRIDFAHPEELLELRGGDGGDEIRVGTLAGNYRASLSITGDQGEDRIFQIGDVTLGDAAGPGDLYYAAESIEIAGSIVTAGGMVEFNGLTRLVGDLSIDSRVEDGGAGGMLSGDIRFIGRLESDDPGRFRLSLEAGSGDILFADVVGDSQPLETLEIGSARDVEFTETVWLAGDLIQHAGSGVTTLRGTGGNGIGGSLSLSAASIRLLQRPTHVAGDAILAAAESIVITRPLDTMNGAKAHSTPGRIDLRSDGWILLGEDGDLLAAAGITQSGSAATVYSAAEWVAGAGGIEFEGRVILTGNMTVDVTSNAQTAVRFHQTIDSGAWPPDAVWLDAGDGDSGEGNEGGDTASGWWLTILSAGGDVAVDGAIGAESPLGRLAVADARDLTFGGPLRTTGDVQQTNGTGTTELRGTSGDATAGEGIGGQLSLDTVAVRGLVTPVYAAGGVRVRAARDLFLEPSAGFDAGSSAVLIEVGAIGLAPDSSAFYGAEAIVRTTSEAADAVTLVVANSGSATLGRFEAGVSTGGVVVTAGGRILNGLSPEEPNIVAAHASLRAGLGIGGVGFRDTGNVYGPLVDPLTGLPAPPLALQVLTVDAQTVAGDIGLSESDDIELCGIIASQGRIEIESLGGRIAIRDGTFLRSATGMVSNSPPLYAFAEENPDDVLVPADRTQEIVGTIGGDATIDFVSPQFEVGRNFTLVIDWPDGQRGVLRGLVAGDDVVWRVGPNNEGTPQVRHGAAPEGQIRIYLQRTYSLTYLQGVPDTEVVTQLTVVNDEGIRLYDQSGANLNESDPLPTVATSISENEFRGGGIVPVEREFTVLVETETVLVIESVSATATQQTRYEDVSLATEQTDEDAAVLFLTRVSADGREEGRTSLPVTELRDLAPLLERLRRAPLRNGLYRLYHQEPGLPPRKVLEFRKTVDGIGDPVREPGRGSNPRDNQPSTPPAKEQPGSEQPGSERPGSGRPGSGQEGDGQEGDGRVRDGRSLDAGSATARPAADGVATNWVRGVRQRHVGSDRLGRPGSTDDSSIRGESIGNSADFGDNATVDFQAIEAALAAADAVSLRAAARWRRGDARRAGVEADAGTPAQQPAGTGVNGGVNSQGVSAIGTRFSS